MRKALATSKTLVVVNLAMNNITPKSGYTMFEVLSSNNSIYNLNIGSFSGAQRNRLGKEGAMAIAAGFRSSNCLIQLLFMKSVSLSNSELEVIADSLEYYPYLHSLDISENRLEGM